MLGVASPWILVVGCIQFMYTRPRRHRPSRCLRKIIALDNQCSCPQLVTNIDVVVNCDRTIPRSAATTQPLFPLLKFPLSSSSFSQSFSSTSTAFVQSFPVPSVFEHPLYHCFVPFHHTRYPCFL